MVAEPQRLVAMMQRCVDLEPKQSAYWEVLAVAHLRAENWQAAIAAAEQVRKLEKRGRGIESFVQAIAYAKLQQPEKATACYDEALMYLAADNNTERENQTRYFDFLSFHREAAQVLDLPEPELAPWQDRQGPSEVSPDR
jgi:tetratricopeptide (TPR) repeat protein